METVSSAAQAVARPLVLTWEDVYERVEKLPISPKSKVYGIPRGGSIVAVMVGTAVDTPDEADVIVDDVVDSGATRHRFGHFDKPFYALVYKEDEGLLGQYVTFPWEISANASIQDAVIRKLQYLGEDVHRSGLRETPARVVRSWDHLFAGYKMNPADILAKRFKAEHHELVILKNIEVFSTCEHHLLPFIGTVSLGYIPQGDVVGISKLARLVECYARRLQIQEQLCRQLVDAMMEHLKPVGAACVMEAQHLCMTARGVNKQQSTMVTSAVRGVFETDVNARQEFLRLIGHGA